MSAISSARLEAPSRAGRLVEFLVIEGRRIERRTARPLAPLAEMVDAIAWWDRGGIVSDGLGPYQSELAWLAPGAFNRTTASGGLEQILPPIERRHLFSALVATFAQ